MQPCVRREHRERNRRDRVKLERELEGTIRMHCGCERDTQREEKEMQLS